MKKISIAAACVLFVLALILPVGLLAALDFATPPQFADTFLAGLHLKYERLKAETDPKIILIGGSSAAFGIDTDLMEENLPYKVVKFGLYATLGTKLMIDLSRDFIREGDIIVIAPELDPQTLSLYFNAEATWQAAESNRAMLWDIAFDNWSDMLGGYWTYLSQKIQRSKQELAPMTGVYSLSALDENGDISYPKEENTMLLGYDPNMMVDLSPEIVSEDFIDYLNEYAAMAEKKGASCYFSFAPTNASALEEGTDEAKILSFFDFLGRALDFDIISDIHDCIMEEGYFYDTNFHLNNTGTTAHTIQLIEDLRRVIGDPTALTLEVPAAPEKSVDTLENPTENGAIDGTEPSETEEGDAVVDNTDYSIYFTYEEYAGGLMITGVTEEGKALAVLKTPDSYDGTAVLAVGEGAFADCAAEEIHLSSSIVQLVGALFDGCDNLKGIYFYAPDATQLTAGAELLDGAPSDVRIYMNLASYATFINNYFWTRFADRMAVIE